MVANDQPSRIEWRCEVCGNSISDGAGYVHSTESDVGAHWTPEHTACGPVAVDYGIAVEQIRTHADMLRWTSHLMDKRWFAGSDWGALIAQTVGPL